MSVDLGAVMSGLASAATLELITNAGSQTPLKAVVANTPSELPAVGVPIMTFEVGDGGVSYKDESLPGNLPRSTVQIWTANILGSVLVNKIDKAAEYGPIEAAAREWYGRVPQALMKHYKLAGYLGNGSLLYLWVSQGRPWGKELTDGWFATVEFDITCVWQQTVVISA